MSEFASNAGFEPFSMPPPPSPPPPPPFTTQSLYELRPLSTGEILDRTFSLYRKRFWLYVGLSSFAAAVSTLGTFAQLTWGITGIKLQTAEGARDAILSTSISLVTIVFYMLAYSITQAATVSAVSAAYLGRETSIPTAFKTVRKRWYRYILIALWMGWSAAWLPTLLFTLAIVLLALRWQLLGGFLAILAALSIVYSIIAYIRNSLGIVASVSESLPVRQSMRRSKFLVAGHKGRVFALMLLLWVLSMAVGVLQATFGVFLGLAHAGARAVLEILTLMSTFVTGSMLAPVGAIAFCLFYIDERVRKEGFDLENLMERSSLESGRGLGPASADPNPPPAQLESPFRTEII